MQSKLVIRPGSIYQDLNDSTGKLERGEEEGGGGEKD